VTVAQEPKFASKKLLKKKLILKKSLKKKKNPISASSQGPWLLGFPMTK